MSCSISCIRPSPAASISTATRNIPKVCWRLTTNSIMGTMPTTDNTKAGKYTCQCASFGKSTVSICKGNTTKTAVRIKCSTKIPKFNRNNWGLRTACLSLTNEGGVANRRFHHRRGHMHSHHPETHTCQCCCQEE